MKKLILKSFTAIVSAALLFSCRSTEVVTPAVVEESSTIPHGVRTFDFSVLVVAASKQGKTEALSGVNVTAVQDGVVTTVTTNADGVAYFKNLNEGNVAYTASAPSGTGTGQNFAVVSGTKNLDVASASYFNNANNTNQKGVVSLILKMPTLSANLIGRVVADFDFNKSTPASAVPGAILRLTYGNASTGNVSAGAAGTSGFEFLEPNFYITTADGTGAFAFTNVPAVENTNMSATLIIEAITTNNGETILFDRASISATNWLNNGRLYNAGAIEILPTVNNTASVTGLVFGDFNFLELQSILSSSQLNIPGGYTISNLKEYYGISLNNGIQTITGGVDLINALDPSININIIVSTVTGTISVTSVNLNSIVIGTNTFIGYVEEGKNKAFGVNLTTVVTTVFNTISTVAGFSAFDVKQKNKVTGLIKTDGTIVPTPTLPASLFLAAGVRVVFKCNASQVSPTYRGATEFVALTDANGKFNIAGLPVLSSGTYTVTMTHTATLVRPDGYTQVVNFEASTTSAPKANVVTDLGTTKVTY